MTTSTRGGLMKGLRRSLEGESFFVNDFSSGQGGLVGVAAVLPGDMTVVPLDGSAALLVQSGSWTASAPGLDVDSGPVTYRCRATVRSADTISRRARR